jgi:hypothetical protein
MRSILKTRLDALETMPSGMSIIEDDAQLAAYRANAMEKLDELLADPLKKQRAYDALDAASRIRHWQEKIAEAKNLVAAGGKKPDEELRRLASPICFDAMKALDLKSAEDSLRSSYQWYLTEAQLDRLAELQFDDAQLKVWQKVHEMCRGLDWQWRREYLELPPNALMFIHAGKQHN